MPPTIQFPNQASPVPGSGTPEVPHLDSWFRQADQPTYRAPAVADIHRPFAAPAPASGVPEAPHLDAWFREADQPTYRKPAVVDIHRPFVPSFLQVRPKPATILYNNGSDPGNINGHDIATSQCANSFKVTHSVVMNQFGVSLYVPSGENPPQSVQWSITTLPFGGTTIASGTTTLGRSFNQSNTLGQDQWDCNSQSAFGEVPLSAGTYYLQLQNAQNGQGDSIQWGENDGTSTGWTDGSTQIGSESFTIAGYPTPSLFYETPHVDAFHRYAMNPVLAPVRVRESLVYVEPLQPTAPPALAWQGHFDLPPRPWAPTQPRFDALASPLEPSLYVRPPALSWQGHFDLAPRGFAPSQPRFDVLAEPFEPSLRVVPVMVSWWRPTDQPTYPARRVAESFFVEPWEPSLWIAPPALAWLGHFELPPRGWAPTQPRFDVFAEPLENSLRTAPPALAWQGHFDLPPRPWAPTQPRFDALAAPLEPSLYVIPVMTCWWRAADQPTYAPRRVPESFFVVPWEISLWTAPPLLSWQGHFEVPPRGLAPTQPRFEVFAAPLDTSLRAIPPVMTTWWRPADQPTYAPRRVPESFFVVPWEMTLWTAPPALSWLGHFELAPRGATPTQPRFDVFCEPLEPSLVLGPPSLSWMDQGTYDLPPRGAAPTQPRFEVFAAPLEPSLWTAPPALAWAPNFYLPPRGGWSPATVLIGLWGQVTQLAHPALSFPSKQTFPIGVLYVNGTPPESDPGNIGGQDITGAGYTNPFSLVRRSQITAFGLSLYFPYRAGGNLTSISWAITTLPFGGSTVASGTATTGITRGVIASPNPLGMDQYDVGLNIAPFTIDAGSYWLQVYSAVSTNDDPTVLWGEIAGGFGTQCFNVIGKPSPATFEETPHVEAFHHYALNPILPTPRVRESLSYVEPLAPSMYTPRLDVWWRQTDQPTYRKPAVADIHRPFVPSFLQVKPASVVVLYTNANPSAGSADPGNIGGHDIATGQCSNSFTVAHSVVVTQFGLSLYVPSGAPAPTSVQWAITTAPFGGTTVKTGTTTLGTSFNQNNALGQDQYDCNSQSAFGEVPLAAGIYYLQLLNALNGNGDSIQWGEIDGTSLAYEFSGGNIQVGSECFSIAGHPTPSIFYETPHVDAWYRPAANPVLRPERIRDSQIYVEPLTRAVWTTFLEAWQPCFVMMQPAKSVSYTFVVQPLATGATSFPMHLFQTICIGQGLA
jgi:hypothetical protein